MIQTGLSPFVLLTVTSRFLCCSSSCAFVVSYVAFGLSLFVPNLFFFDASEKFCLVIVHHDNMPV